MSNVRLWDADWDRTFVVGDWRVVPGTRTISRQASSSIVEPRVIALLIALARQAGEVVRREQLIDEIWQGAPGADQSLSNAISLLRQALGGGEDARRLIVTVPKQGYRLEAAVHWAEDVLPSPVPESRVRQFGLYNYAFAPLLIVGLIIGVWGWNALTGNTEASGASTSVLQSREQPASSAQSSAQGVFLAVAPFDHDDDLAPLATVLTDEINQIFDKPGQIRTADGSEASQVAQGSLPADLVVRGELRNFGDGLTARLSIVDAEGRFVAFGDGVTVEAGDTLALRSAALAKLVPAVALAVSERLSAASEVGETPRQLAVRRSVFKTPPTDNLQAYNAYLEGVFHVGRYTPEDTRRAVEKLEQAVALAPHFAEAHAALGGAYMLAGSHQGAMSPTRTRQAAKSALYEAVVLDPGSADAFATLGDFQNCVERDPEEAGKSFARALQLDPALVHHGYARYLISIGSVPAAKRQIARGLARHPNSVTMRTVAAQHLLSISDVEPALEHAAWAAKNAPTMAEARRTYGAALMAMGDTQRAMGEFRAAIALSGESPRMRLALLRALVKNGDLVKAREIFDDVMTSSDFIPNLQQAIALTWLGEPDRAFAALEAAFEDHEIGLCYLSAQPVWDAIREDPRFARMVARQAGKTL